MIGIWRRSGQIMTRIIIRKSTNTDAYNTSTKIVPDLIIYLVKTKSSRQIDMNELHWERYGEQLEDRLPKGDEGPLVEDFWMHAKMVLRRYKGIKVANFELYLKECEFRFNYGSGDEKITTLEDWCLLE